MFRVLIIAIAMVVFSTYALAKGDHENHDHAQHKKEPELVITPVIPKVLKAHETNKVVLFIQDKQAQPVAVSQLEMVHTQPIHLLIIDSELTDYHHEHPVPKATGQYLVNFTPQAACDYRIWVDIQLKGSWQQYIPVDLKGTEACNEPVDNAVKLEASSQGYDFKLAIEGDLTVGAAVLANLSISQKGQSVDFLEPVMGAFAHMVGFYEGSDAIAHIHPLGDEPSNNAERGGPTLRFHLEPKQTGYLKLFAQVQIDGKQVFAPFGVIVK